MNLLEKQKQNIEFFIKQKNAQHEVVENVNILRYDASIRGEMKPCLALFIGNMTRATSNYYYSTHGSREDAIQEAIAIQRRHADDKRKKADARKAFIPTSKAGDIFVCSWGYEQTNIDFYLLLSVKGKTGTFIEIGEKVVEDSVYSHGMACEVMPDASKRIGEPFTKLISKSGNSESISLASYKYCKRWNGSPEYKSWYY
jgi:hypothetical protein